MKKINKFNYYSIIPATILFNNQIKPNEKLLYAMLTSLAGKEEIPCIVRNLTDEEAVILMVEISYLKKDEQYTLLNAIEFNDSTPSLAQAIIMKKRSKENTLTADKIDEIMEEEKANQIPKFKMNMEKIVSVLLRDLITQEEIEEFILMCVKEHNKRQREKDNYSR